ncbi:RHS repeat-associated core domain-containing protein [Acinetobacter courvalinii]|uniref:RHS repeat-associated core domain-containing protein n=1 Tax=Acinetobacter courvalinii TaxID=280147 RepID=UPI003F5707C7
MYNYDNYDRIIQKSQTVKGLNLWGGAATPLTVKYDYSNGGKPSSLTLPSGRKISYSYNSVGQLINLSQDSTVLLNNISYNAGGFMTGWKWGSGQAEYNIAYDLAQNGTIKKISNRSTTGAINYSIEYGFNEDGQIISFTRNEGSTVDNFTYDKANRLTSESRGSYTINYSYDRNGNRRTLRATGAHQQTSGNVDYTYIGNRLNTWNKNGVSQPITYSEHGDLIQAMMVASVYDGAGRKLWQLTSNEIGFDTRYNHKNERTVITNNSNGGWEVARNNAIQYVYDEQSHLIGEYDHQGNALVEYIWLEDQPIAAIYGKGASSKIYYIVADAQNTPRRLIDSTNQAIVWSWDSTAFGVGEPQGTITFNLRFPGQYYDAYSKLFYNHNRYYNPELGRYMEVDPIGLDGGSNPYSYAYQNPIMYVDSTGAIATPVITGLIGGVVGGGASLGVQIMKNKGFENIKWKDVGVAASVGAVAGAISPWTAQTAIGAVVTGSGSNVASYWLTQTVNNEPTTTTGFVASAGLGAIGGKLSGPVSRPLQGSSIRAGESQFISRAEANRVNWNINMNSMIRDIDRNLTIGGVGGAIVAGDPFGMGGYNFYSNQATLPYRLPTIRCQAGKGCQ